MARTRGKEEDFCNHRFFHSTFNVIKAEKHYCFRNYYHKQHSKLRKFLVFSVKDVWTAHFTNYRPLGFGAT